MGSKGQDAQATVPQFFKFGSNSGNNVSPVSVGFESAVNKTNEAATSSMKPKSVPKTTPEIQCEKGWYISPFDGKKKMTCDNPAFVGTRKERNWSESVKKQVALFLQRRRPGLGLRSVKLWQKKFAVGRTGNWKAILIAQLCRTS